ncbi:MAG: GvpL/GvpF family gas vesicle protein [Gemmatimonadaceae bacterium]
MASGKGSGLRFYAVVDTDFTDREVLDADKLRLVAFRDLAAVVTVAPYVRAKPSDADLERYVRIIDALEKHGPVIPAPPGTIFRDESVLLRWLDVHFAKLHETLGIIERREDGNSTYEYVRMDLGV